jgi:hypothetical protein
MESTHLEAGWSRLVRRTGGGGVVVAQPQRAYDRLVDLRLDMDPEAGVHDTRGHGVTETDVEEVLARPVEGRPSRDDSRVALGQTRAGRYLRVVYVPDPVPSSVFVITAFDLGPKAKHALRRRRKRKA